jgi:ABC-type spermidine/putrescine transport system permease subunit I
MVVGEPRKSLREIHGLAGRLIAVFRTMLSRDPELAQKRRYALLVLPSLVLLFGMFLMPLLWLISASVYDGGFTARHYVRLFTVSAYVKVSFNTLRMALAVTGICVVIGFPVAYKIATGAGIWRNLLIIAVLMPFWTSVLVRSYGWMVILHPNGILNSALSATGLVSEPLELVHNTTGVLIGMTQIMLPYMVLPLATVMQRVDPELLRAAKSLGAAPVSSFLWIYLPLILPGIVAGSLLVFIISLGFFVVPALLGGTEDVTLAQLIDFNINTTLNWGFAAALSSVLLLSALCIFALAVRVARTGNLWDGLA